jgi:TetR/AcrR family transcriptional regulator
MKVQQNPLASQEPSLHPRMSGEHRRHQLIEVAIDLFSRKGFGGTTTREIAAAAGVTEAIIFRHFATKQDLYNAILDYKRSASGLDNWLLKVEALMQRNDDEGLFRLIVTKIIEIHRHDPRFERLMMHAALEGHELAVMHHNRINLTFGARMKEYIGKRQAAGALSACDPETVLFAVAGAAQFYAMQKYIYQLCEDEFCKATSDEQMTGTLVHILMNGLKRSA